MKFNLKKTSGFTLVELIIVITLISALAIIAIAYFRGQIHKANDAKRKADLDRIKIGLEEYEKDHNCYPLSNTVVCDPGTGLRPYLDKIPCDPVTRATYYYEYEDSACPSWFRLYAKLDNPNDVSALPFCGPLNSFNYYVASPNAPSCVPVAGGGSGGGGSGGGTTPPSGGGGGGGGGVTGNFYGCKNGACVQIQWDPARPGPECDPNYQNSNCYGVCGPVGNECRSWH